MSKEDVEQVDLDLNVSEVRYQRAEFAAVVFFNIAETYPADAHVECQYTITKDLVPSTRDWIGLYKVGWMRVQDHVYYEWAPYPENYETGKEANGHVLFQSHRLPGDDGEFYQFCYVSSVGQIRGASMPFQFRQPHAEDFVEVLDDETDMLVVRCKTAVLEESLKMAEKEKHDLITIQKSLQAERDGLVDKLCAVDEKLKKEKKKMNELLQTKKGDDAKIQKLIQEAGDMTLVHDGLNSKVEKLEQGKQILQEQLENVEKELEMTKSAVKKLQNDKDELEGVVKNLQEECEMFKNQYSSTETTFKSQAVEIERLQKRLDERIACIHSLKEECDRLKQQLAAEKKKVTELTVVGKAQKDSIELISNQLKNAEDKLEAAEENKNMLQNEMKTYEETQKKMSVDLEEKQEFCHQMKQKMCVKEESYSNETKHLKTVIGDLEQQLSDTEKKKEEYQSEIKMLKLQSTTHQSTSETALSSMYALKLADDKLKERFTKLQEEFKDVSADNKKKQKQVREKILELEDMKEHLRQAKEEYKTLYIEKQKLQKKLDKKSEKKRSRSDQQSPPPKGVVTETLQTSSEPPEEEDTAAFGASEACELREHLGDLGTELQNFQDSKKKYKQALQEERSRQDTLRKHYHEDLEKRQREIEKLRKSKEDITSEYEMKIRALENFIVDKDKRIEELNQKLRDNVRLAYEPKSPEKKSDPVSPKPCSPATLQESCIYLPPLQYPQHEHKPLTRLVYPGNQEMVREVEEQLYEVGESLHEPLTPLPPPIEPIVLPSAKLAAVRASMDPSPEPSDQGSELELFVETDMKTNLSDNSDGPVVIPTAPILQHEERFLDAIGESMKLCPVCDQSFSADTPERTFNIHVLHHSGQICPVCLKIVDDECSDADFVRHVNSHF